MQSETSEVAGMQSETSEVAGMQAVNSLHALEWAHGWATTTKTVLN